MHRDFGTTLKECRNNAGMSVKKISELLTQKGFKASESTIYSWENGNSQPTPNAMLAMCKIYGITDVLSVFGYDGYNERGGIQLSMQEVNIIEKYRTLSEYDKETIRVLLDRECDRESAVNENHDDTIVDIDSHNYAKTRHITYIERLVSAGKGAYIFNDIPSTTIEVPYTDKSRNADFVVPIRGNSMEPTFHDNDKVLVQKNVNVAVGDVAIFIDRDNNESFIKELGDGRLISHNKDYPDMIPSKHVDIIGKVLGKVE